MLKLVIFIYLIVRTIKIQKILTSHYSVPKTKISLSSKTVSEEEFDACLAIIRASPGTHFIQKDSELALTTRENINYIFGFRAILMQLCFKSFVEDLRNSRLLQNPVNRGFETAKYMYQLIYKDKNITLPIANKIRLMHKTVKNNRASRSDAMDWIMATLYDSGVLSSKILNLDTNKEKLFQDIMKLYHYFGKSNIENVDSSNELENLIGNVIQSDLVGSSDILDNYVKKFIFKNIALTPIVYLIYCINLITLHKKLQSFMPYNNIISRIIGYMGMVVLLAIYRLLPSKLRYSKYYLA